MEKINLYRHLLKVFQQKTQKLKKKKKSISGQLPSPNSSTLVVIKELRLKTMNLFSKCFQYRGNRRRRGGTDGAWGYYCARSAPSPTRLRSKGPHDLVSTTSMDVFPFYCATTYEIIWCFQTLDYTNCNMYICFCHLRCDSYRCTQYTT